ncbi:MAG: ABC-F family ATP-binding cassette domain-containing protein [Sedimentisphaerales bacterium]|nr:ABC-F family ATP-binding cassette domain-containing protein [Sedimentisphaerales bacterium]
MSKHSLQFHRVTFFYETSSDSILDNVSTQIGSGWTGIIGGNGAGKTTFLRLACGLLQPTQGDIIIPQNTLYCDQRTDEFPPEFNPLLQSSDTYACKLRGQLGLELDWLSRWHTLSHGERKRVQIAIALWQNPQVLALDEPTNHIDLPTRQLLIQSLTQFQGIGLLVSHDQEMLDHLCRQTLFIDTCKVSQYPGGYSQAIKFKEAEYQRAHKNRSKARHQLTRLQRERSRRRGEADQADRKRSKRGLSRKDSDGRAKRDLARVSGKDGQAGRQLSQLDGRYKYLQEQLDNTFVKKQTSGRMTLQGEHAQQDRLLHIEPGFLNLGHERKLHFPELLITPSDRIGIIGRNGAGKSTLIRHLLKHKAIPENRLVYIPQEIDTDFAYEILYQVEQKPKMIRGELFSYVARLGSDTRRLLETERPSPGELRKLKLALGMIETPYLIVMDEPTNHLDLPSIEALEKALSACHSALILVSHNLHFLKSLVTSVWQLTPVTANPNSIKLRIQPVESMNHSNLQVLFSENSDTKA